MIWHIEIPFASLPSRANEKSGDNYWKRAALVKRQRQVTRIALLGEPSAIKWQVIIEDVRLDASLAHRLDVYLVRVAPRALDDDNLRHSLKAIRDEFTSWLGLRSDRDPRLRWEYGQIVDGRPKYHAVRIYLAPMASCSKCGRSILPIEIKDFLK
jgi:hypothetical protein